MSSETKSLFNKHTKNNKKHTNKEDTIVTLSNKSFATIIVNSSLKKKLTNDDHLN